MYTLDTFQVMVKKINREHQNSNILKAGVHFISMAYNKHIKWNKNKVHEQGLKIPYYRSTSLIFISYISRKYY